MMTVEKGLKKAMNITELFEKGHIFITFFDFVIFGVNYRLNLILNGFYWGSCHDINECERGEEVHSCSHICQNLPGSFRCRCPVGFALAKDGRTCLSIAKNFASVVGMLFSQSVDYKTRWHS